VYYFADETAGWIRTSQKNLKTLS